MSDSTIDHDRRGMKSQAGILAAVLAAAAITAASYFIFSRMGHGVPSSSVAETQIEAKFAALGVQPHTVELTSEKALRLRAAIIRGDFKTATAITTAVLASSHLENWRFHPFSEFMNGISDLTDPLFKTNLDKWVVQAGSNALPSLVRAQFYYDLGWTERGHNFSSKVDPHDMTAFGQAMTLALADVGKAIKLDGNRYAFYLRLRILQGVGGPKERMKEAFQAGVAKYPNFYALYRVMLRTYEPKWGGTIPAMYAFVKQYAGPAPAYSPLKLLYLDLYNSLLNTAAVACGPYRHDRDQTAQCVKTVMQKIATRELESEALNSFQLYDHTDKYQFGIFVGDVLGQMIATKDAELFSGMMLQAAADAMHSDTQLSEDKPHSNNYVIDELVGESWYMKGFYENALKKYGEAIKDSASTDFPNEEAKDIALANIYEWIALVYEHLNQYADLAAYEKAAIALRGRTNYEYFVCYGYYRLKDYKTAIQACSKTLGGQTANLKARYWRGRAYEDAGNKNAALKDLSIVAGSEDSFRAYAAIDMSMIYFDRHDNRGALNVLNKYKYLYDPNLSSKSDAAVAYNNRCYALMQLGELREALTDCTASLKYGNIPDAFERNRNS